MINKNEGCKGCNQYIDIRREECKLPPSYFHYDISYTCPCQTCLVKGICNDQCEKYRNYVQKYYYNERPEHRKLIDNSLSQNHLNTSEYRVQHYHRDIPILIKYDNFQHKWGLFPYITISLTHLVTPYTSQEYLL